MLRNKLEQLLSNLPIINDKKIFIWGTGNTALLYQQGLERLEDEGFFVEAYVDSDSQKWGKKFAGKNIISPDEVNNDGNIVLICSPQPKVVRSIFEQMESMLVDCFHIDELIFKLHKKDILKVFDSLSDEKSQEVYYRVIEARISGRYPDEKVYEQSQYFSIPQFLHRNVNDIFVDCGAYVGDSIEHFLWHRDGVFKKIIAFEPDKGNFSAMKKRIGRLIEEWNIREENINLYNCALGNENSIKSIESYADNNGLGSKLVDAVESQDVCQVVTIDETIQEPITFLKADIESYEYKMLEGAKDSIAKWKPLLAICIYHNAIDMYSIPIRLKEMVPEYKFAIRHHSYQLDETVLYAWVE